MYCDVGGDVWATDGVCEACSIQCHHLIFVGEGLLKSHKKLGLFYLALSKHKHHITPSVIKG